MMTTANGRIGEICRRLGGALHPHPDVSEADWQRWLEGYTAPAASTSRHCPECGDRLVERSGRHGRFLGCASYPTCTYSTGLEAT